MKKRLNIRLKNKATQTPTPSSHNFIVETSPYPVHLVEKRKIYMEGQIVYAICGSMSH